MAGGLSQAYQQKVLDYLFGATALPVTGPWYLALYTTAPTDTTAGTEVSTTGTNYARASLAQGSAWKAATAATPSVKANNGAIAFGAPSGDWGRVVAWAIVDTASGACTILAFGNLTAAKNVNNGDPAPSFADAALTISLD